MDGTERSRMNFFFFSLKYVAARPGTEFCVGFYHSEKKGRMAVGSHGLTVTTLVCMA